MPDLASGSGEPKPSGTRGYSPVANSGFRPTVTISIRIAGAPVGSTEVGCCADGR
jgi:hypothetical protein